MLYIFNPAGQPNTTTTALVLKLNNLSKKLIMATGPNLYLLCIHQSDTALFCECKALF